MKKFDLALNILSSDFYKFKRYGGMTNSEIAIFLAGLKRGVFLCSDLISATKISKGLLSFGLSSEIIANTRENSDIEDKNLQNIAGAISGFLSGKIDFLLCLSNSVLTKFDLSFFKSVTLKSGENYNLKNLTEKLSSLGYEKVDNVSSPCEFALRGDILDIFPLSEENPIRLDFFDENLEKINFFDVFSMNLGQKIDFFEIYPCSLPFGNDDIFSLSENFVINEEKQIEKDLALLKEQDIKIISEFEKLKKRAKYIFNSLDIEEYDNRTIGEKSYVKDFLSLEKDISSYVSQGFSVILFGGEKYQILENFLAESKISFSLCDKNLAEKKINISKLDFPFSFSFLQRKIIAIGYEDLFTVNISYKHSSKKEVFYLPKINDYVVHEFYGIGRCIAIEKMQVASDIKDYFILEYKNNSKLYLPTSQANLISAYSGGEAEPKLSNLATHEFERTKQKVKAHLKEISGELAKIYKARKSQKGFKFERDDALENAFSKSFKYELTPDQASAILDVENDMTSDRIMDRLICGDVGFGKTEVAMRASFKAVLNSKQVLVLCPTTILSIQHFKTFSERMKDFGVRIEVFNRFKTKAECSNILKRLKAGEIDILIGTHKALSKDVQFCDLGLLVLDEEQRFGVVDKEKIKAIRNNIDVLSMSATPIPRTLHMSLSGIRDISIIATPPKERLPIQTYITPFDDEVLKKALTRELQRNGKAFVIYNRVLDIQDVASHIRSLISGAKVAVAHGQMETAQLENIIARLYNDEFNILVSTTLIENGVDLPSANTLFIINSDLLGLSQLYQLRGRIGRGDKLAYAYLTYNPNKFLTSDSIKRLEAINEFRELGSGFKIAMKDLEIRGAGNVLGREQHGHMVKVGYDLYMKLLEEVLSESQNLEYSERKNIKINVALSAYIPDELVENSDERIKFYTQISEISSEEEYKNVCVAFKSAYKKLPKETENLCKIAFLKNLMAKYPVKEVSLDSAKYQVVLEKGKDYNELLKLLNDFTLSLKNQDLPILFKEDKTKSGDKLNIMIKRFLLK